MLKIETVADKKVLIESEISFLKLFQKGKVREVYEKDDYLIIVATDRISAFDVIMRTGVPSKGKYLTAQSSKWFKEIEKAGWKTHFISDDLDEIADIIEEPELKKIEWLKGRVMLGRKAKPLPIEAVCRFRIFGSALSALKNGSWVWDQIELEGNLEPGVLIKDGPVFTPTEKSETDDKISFEQMIEEVGEETALKVKTATCDIFRYCNHLAKKEMTFEIADGKIEWGFIDDELAVIDEAFTSDSARFIPDKSKEAFRQWLISNNHKGESVEIPENIALEISELYKSQCIQMGIDI